VTGRTRPVSSSVKSIGRPPLAFHHTVHTPLYLESPISQSRNWTIPPKPRRFCLQRQIRLALLIWLFPIHTDRPSNVSFFSSLTDCVHCAFFGFDQARRLDTKAFEKKDPIATLSKSAAVNPRQSQKPKTGTKTKPRRWANKPTQQHWDQHQPGLAFLRRSPPSSPPPLHHNLVLDFNPRPPAHPLINHQPFSTSLPVPTLQPQPSASSHLTTPSIALRASPFLPQHKRVS